MCSDDSECRAAANTLHVWIIATTASDGALTQLKRLLNDDENERQSRIPSLALRRSYIVAHSALRFLLGIYLDRDPVGIQFTSNAYGKPALEDPESLRFNMSRSGDVAIIAFSPDCIVGVDVERIRSIPALDQVSRRVLSPHEAAELMLIPVSDRNRVFFWCWTRKEAYSKATGQGLLTPFDQFCVSVRPDTPARFICIDNNSVIAQQWSLRDLAISQEYAAALAYPGSQREICIKYLHDVDAIFSPAAQVQRLTRADPAAIHPHP